MGTTVVNAPSRPPTLENVLMNDPEKLNTLIAEFEADFNHTSFPTVSISAVESPTGLEKLPRNNPVKSYLAIAPFLLEPVHT